MQLCANTGTYVDSPFHRYADGADLAELPLDRLADLDAVVVDSREQARRPIGVRAASRSRAGRCWCARAGSRHWRTDAYFEGHPFLTADAAAYLVDQGALLVGIDSLNIDDTATGERPVHSTLLAAGIPICEHLTNLDALPDAGFRFSAVPVKLRGLGTFPVRSYAVL